MDIIPIRNLKPMSGIDLQTHVNNPSLATPLLSSSISIALIGFKRTPILSFKLRPSGQLFQNHVWPIPNLNAPIQDTNPSILASSTSTNKVDAQ